MFTQTQTPASGFPGVADDLIFSGAGSGCAGDDEDEECSPIYESNTGKCKSIFITLIKFPSLKKKIINDNKN